MGKQYYTCHEIIFETQYYKTILKVKFDFGDMTYKCLILVSSH